jgi:hypothetical protein
MFMRPGGAALCNAGGEAAWQHRGEPRALGEAQEPSRSGRHGRAAIAFGRRLCASSVTVIRLAATGVPADASQRPTAAGDPIVRRTRERLRRLEGRTLGTQWGPGDSMISGTPDTPIPDLDEFLVTVLPDTP